MAELILGPILRHVDSGEATVWVETDVACQVSVNGYADRTFRVEGHHYALVEVGGLRPGQATPYTVELDGRRVWPEEESELPPSVIRPRAEGEEVSVAFGSCRVALPHEPPFVLQPDEDSRGHGIDALRAFALRLARDGARPPDCLLMLGDQIYADDLSPAMLEVTGSRSDLPGAPDDVLGDFEEYALAYREAWGEPIVRWLLSTVPTAMIFDDHEIHAQWRISAAWERTQRESDWYEEHISAGLMAYWVYQHVGNLSPRELADLPLLRRVREADDAGGLLRRELLGADEQSGHSRWSFCRDIGGVHLVVIDSRAGRVLEPPTERRMIGEDEWRWIREHAEGEWDHLLLASSVPVFLPKGLHDAESWDALLADGHRWRLGARLAERVRQRGVMDHWPAFPNSMAEVVELLGDVATGRHGDGDAPESIVLLSGDVHHCYLARVELTEEPDAQPPIFQATCSAYRKNLAAYERRLIRLLSSRTGSRIAHLLSKIAGAPHPAARWELVGEPCYDNQIASLSLARGRALLRVETPRGSDWRNPELATAFEQDLLAVANDR